MRSRLVWLLVVAVTVPGLIDAGLGAARPVDDGAGTCWITQVVDGDTLRLWCEGGLVRVRLTGFDTPELYSPHCLSEQLAAWRAKWGLRLALWRADGLRMVRQGKDRFGRDLVAMSLGDEPLAAAMIAAGHARAYDGGRREGWCGG